MENYPFLKNLFISVFSVDVGLEKKEEIAALKRILSDNYQRVEIEKELKQLFLDNSISLCKLLENEDYLVYPADNEEDAKEYIIENLWNIVFPNKFKTIQGLK